MGFSAHVLSVRRTGKAAQVRALHMKYPELNTSALARRVGVSPQSAADTLKRFLADHTEEELRSFQARKVDAFDAITMRSLAFISNKKLQKASAPALMMVAGTAHDKSQVLRGMPTGLDVHVLMDIASIIRGDRGNKPG